MRSASSRLSVFAFLLAAATLLPAATPSALAQSSADKQQYYQIYVTDFRSDNYESALRNWRWIMENDPLYSAGGTRDDRNYRRGFEAYLGLAENASGDQKRAYVDSALTLAERAVPEVREAGGEVDEYKWTRRRARALHQNARLFEDGRSRATVLFREMYDAKPSEIDPWYLDQIVRGYYSQDDKESALAFLDELKADRSGEADVQEILDKWYPEFFDTPAERITFLEGQLEEDPENGELMQQLLSLYQQTGQSDEVSRLQSRILESDPTPELYRAVANTRLDDGEPQKAFDLFQRMLELPEAEATAQDYYNMGVAKQQMGQLSSARTHFRRALDIDSNFGSAYMAIANIYAGAVSNCTGGGELALEDRAVYWLATDYYQRAKSVDPSVSSAANQNIARYREYFPSTEKIFFEGWELGQSYSVDYGCYAWIGETTTVKEPA